MLMLVCFALRYFATTTAPMPGDEAWIVHQADEISFAPGGSHLPYHTLGHHLGGQLYLAKLGTLLLGHNIVGFRFMSVVLGTASCWVLFALVRRVWGFWPAAMSLFLLTFNGFHIGVSRSAIERTYLFFSVLAIYLFWRAVQERRPWFMIAAGAVIGAGAIVSEHTFLLLPAFAVYLALSKAHRPWLARWHPYAGVLVAVAVCLPLVCLSLRSAGGEPSTLHEDYADRVERLGRLGLSWGPAALYIAPLFYKLSGRVSVYPVMSLVSGALLLTAVLHAHFGRRGEFTTLLLVIFWLFVGGFSLFTSLRPEFKWAATSVFAAVPLAGRLLWELWTRRVIYGVFSCLPLAYIAGFAFWVANISDNCYYSVPVPPLPAQIAWAQRMQGAFTGAALHHDFPSLMDSPFFPARYRKYYFEQYLLVADLAHKEVMNPILMQPVLERAADIDPDHPELRRLMKLLEERGPVEGKLSPKGLRYEEVFPWCPGGLPRGPDVGSEQQRPKVVIVW
jgi:hypothetical protein